MAIFTLTHLLILIFKLTCFNLLMFIQLCYLNLFTLILFVLFMYQIYVQRCTLIWRNIYIYIYMTRADFTRLSWTYSMACWDISVTNHRAPFPIPWQQDGYSLTWVGTRCHILCLDIIYFSAREVAHRTVNNCSSVYIL